MKRYEIYLDNEKRLNIDVYSNIESEYESKKYKGKACYDIIKKLASNNILDIYEKRNSMEATLEYKNYIITLNEYEELLNKLGMKPIVLSIENYYSNKSLKSVKSNKVIRKNKFSNKRIIAIGLAAIVIGTIAVPNLKKLLSEDNNIDISSITETNYTPEEYNILKNLVLSTDEDEIAINTSSQEETVNYIAIDYDDRSDTEKAINTRNNYSYIIEKYAKMYGLDSRLVMAIATQERGSHSINMDRGGATGLMQIQNSVWEGESITAYNFDTKKNETLNITNSMISDLNTNIKLGCMVLQNNLKSMNYNTLAAIQCYNMGYGNMQKILNNYSKDSNKSKEDILNNPTDIGWLNYRNLINVGDQKYLEHVLSWYGDTCNITNISNTGEKVCININNNINKKVY